MLPPHPTRTSLQPAQNSGHSRRAMDRELEERDYFELDIEELD